MIEGQNGELRGRIAMLLRKKREIKGYSLQEICNHIGNKFPFDLAKSTLAHYEKNGPSIEATRLLILLKHYRIDLDSLFDQSNSTPILSDFQKDELLNDENFLNLCQQLFKLKPEPRRGMICALSKFLQTFGNTPHKRKEMQI